MFIILFVIAIISFIPLASCTIENFNKPVTNDPPVNYLNTDEWNKAKDVEQTYDINSLYNLTAPPKLEELLLNSIFIKHEIENHLPYLYGYSPDGHYAAFIYYVDNKDKGFLVQIFDTLSGNVTYSVLIPDDDKMVESREFALAKEVLDKGFHIQITPDKLGFQDGMEYKINDETWYFQEEKNESNSFMRIANNKTKNYWLLLEDKNISFKEKPIEMFTFPGKPDFITFIIHQNLFNKNPNIDFTPVFIKLANINAYNSTDGKRREADIWLYGNFSFIYNQWNTGSQTGFIATIPSNNVSDGNTKQTEENKVNQTGGTNSSQENVGQTNQIMKTEVNKMDKATVDQWIYLDYEGKMQWYGNARGIFNAETKPIQPNNHLFYYHIQVIPAINSEAMQYFVVDQYDKNTNELLRTIEFKWDDKTENLVPIQKIQTYE